MRREEHGREEKRRRRQVLVTNARAQKTRDGLKQVGDQRVREKEGGKTQPNFSPP